ncbi:MAG: hypothetical protein HY319_01595 [Armatimonadetes bacterium]|nr:hypothetical protein [Armatimonadota bacterium]
MQTHTANGESKAFQTNPGILVKTVKDTTVLALEGAKDISSAALGGVVHVVADTTSNTLKAAEGVTEDLTTLTRKMMVHAIRGFQDVTVAFGNAMLENACGSVRGAAVLGEEVGAATKDASRGMIQGTSEVGAELGEAAKQAAIGFIHGSAEVGAEFGKVCKSGALGFIKGTGEVTAELGAVAKSNALGFIEGGTETALSLEKAFMLTARVFLRNVAELRAEHAANTGGAPETQPVRKEPESERV